MRLRNSPTKQEYFTISRHALPRAAMAASNLPRASSGTKPRFTNVPTTRRIRRWTTSSATMSSGSASRNRACTSASKRNGTLDAIAPRVSFGDRQSQQRQPRSDNVIETHKHARDFKQP
jgi:hypothetical protein